MPFMFERLEVYQRSVDFATEVAALCEAFPRGYGFLSNQFCRAALSIAANLAEGNGRVTKPDRRYFFLIARGSAQECVPMIEVARRRDLLDDEIAGRLRDDLETIGGMINGLIGGMGKRKS